MTDEEMSKEIKENNIKENPFDTLFYFSINMVRNLLNASHEYSDDINDDLSVEFNNYKRRIDAELRKLRKLSNETINMLREASSYHDDKIFAMINTELSNMETCWNSTTNDRFEQILYGKESDKYKRILELRALIDEYEELKLCDDSELRGMLEAVNSPTLGNIIGMMRWKTKKEIVDKYKLSSEDIEYIISYRRNELRKGMGLFEMLYDN